MPLYEWLINKRLRCQYLVLLLLSALVLLGLYFLYRNTPGVSENSLTFITKICVGISFLDSFLLAPFY